MNYVGRHVGKPMDVIFDIDGTLADITHRRHHVATKPKNWQAFAAGCADDKVNEPIAAIGRLFLLGNRIICCSGRNEAQREVTETWLDKMWGLVGRHSALYMRADGDYRADDIVKEELLDRIIADGYWPVLAFDDRDRVVAMWRRRGLVCCQVAEGDF